ncbi:MAG: glutamate racemase [Spirochaetes bacterium RBG_13_51_14]|nr:MAG: glutamate racemase [Spirochaetes bacterium RBG_13_51_14]
MKDRSLNPIGVFDSGYGGLTILKEFVRKLPEYDFIYLGDNARNPYGGRSYETVYAYTLEAVRKLFQMGCHLIIIACNTASAKALRTIQQKNLPEINDSRRVLGVIRPTVEILGSVTRTKHVGVLGTAGTVSSNSYLLEIKKLFPDFTVTQEACPLWVPLVENNELRNPGADYFVRMNIDRLLAADPDIDAIILGCTHYPLLLDAIRRFTPPRITIIPQDQIVADSLIDYLRRHPEINERSSRNGSVSFYTTDSTALFDELGTLFFQKPVHSEKISM